MILSPYNRYNRKWVLTRQPFCKWKPSQANSYDATRMWSPKMPLPSAAVYGQKKATDTTKYKQYGKSKILNCPYEFVFALQGGLFSHDRTRQIQQIRTDTNYMETQAFSLDLHSLPKTANSGGINNGTRW